MFNNLPSFSLPKPLLQQSRPANVSHVFSGSQMAGLGVLFIPKVTGKVRITFSCLITVSNTSVPQIIGVYGTGPAPTIGAALVGIATSGFRAVNLAGGAFAVLMSSDIVSLTVGDTYWFDYQVSGGGTLGINNNTIVFDETYN